ncbi:hypothetical protein IYY11_21310 [Methylocystis sp. H62]|uniref:hypothetical protein n=1 Tax=Methylocystis sp. H62 TaxID=2785789 RepID=UPI0018C1D35E|nr:hypothetical protein [Methylocystis sp. H62]MBG0795900.1 hypothetical protein [Methylocystis sp. H62]
MENRGYVRFVGGETKCFASTSKPKGILASILRTLETRGVTRRQIEDQGIDIEAMEQAFAKIDERQFQMLLNLDHFHPIQIVVIEAMERHAPSVAIDSRDPGTMFGRF